MDALGVRQLVVFGCLFFGYTMYVVCRKDFAFVIPIIGKSDEPMDNEAMGWFRSFVIVFNTLRLTLQYS